MAEILNFPSKALRSIYREGKDAARKRTLGYFQCPYANSQAIKTWRDGWLAGVRIELRQQIQRRKRMECPWQ